MDIIQHNYVFDVDDVMTNTNADFRRRVEYLVRKNPTLQRDFDQWTESKGSSFAMPARLRRIADEHIVKSGEFMLTAPPTKLTWNIKAFKELLVSNIQRGGRNHVCSHRGYHALGAERTEAWLHLMDIREHFTDLHFISSKVHPNKLRFLSTKYDNFTLVDDNPMTLTGTVHPHDPRLVVYNEIADYPDYQHQRKANSLEQVIEALK